MRPHLVFSHPSCESINFCLECRRLFLVLFQLGVRLSQLHLGLVVLVIELLQLNLQPGHLLLALVQAALGLLVLQLGPLQVVSILVAVSLDGAVKLRQRNRREFQKDLRKIKQRQLWMTEIIARILQAGGNTFPCNEKGFRQNVLVSAKCAGDGMLRSRRNSLAKFHKSSVFCLRNVPNGSAHTAVRK